jgi:broad specificity phosphatase PhoE
MRRFVLSLLLILLFAAPAAAQQLVFVVRHAERADAAAGSSPMMASDPDLSEAGRTRAQSLATMLKDAKIAAIFVTPYKRTRQTAEPLAKALGIEATAIDPKDAAGLIEKVRAVKGNVLVVGHSNTVPDVLTRLGATDAPKLDDTEYDNLFVVIGGEKPTLVRLHFR